MATEFTLPNTNELTVSTTTGLPTLGIMGATDLVKASFIQWLAAADEEQESLYRTYRDYYDGEHIYQLTDRMREFLELDANIKFDLNYLPIPIDVLNERLRVTGFDSDDKSQGGDEGTLWDWWKLNRMDAHQGDVHHAMLRDGDDYVLVEWDNERGIPLFSLETAFDGTNGVLVRYSEETRRLIRFAIKRWRIESGPSAGTVQRMNVYTADAIYKYISGRDGWEPLLEAGPEGPLPWPLPWLTKGGKPLGVPIVHFRNNAGGYDFGKSELHDLIPAQDALNKAVIDELAGADIEGFSLITLSGGEAPDDDFELGPRRVIHAPTGTWGSIAAGNLQGLTALVTAYVMRMAQMSRTPLSYFQISGQVSSAESQKATDTGLVSKAENRSVYTGNAWEDVMIIGRKLHNTFGEGEMAEATIETVWDSFERVDKLETEKARAEIVASLVRDAGTTLEGAADIAGYTEEQKEKLIRGDMVDGIEM